MGVSGLLQQGVCNERDCLIVLVIRAPTLKAEDPGLNSRLQHCDFSGSSHISD